MSDVGRIAEYWSDEARMAAALARRTHQHPTGPTRIAAGDHIRFVHEGKTLEGSILSRAPRLGADTYHVATPLGGRHQILRHQIVAKLDRSPLAAHIGRVSIGEPDKWAMESLAEAWTDEARAASAEARRAKKKAKQEATGTCYQDAFGRLACLGKSWKLAHGTVAGQGPLAGQRFDHAWVENETHVQDHSNGLKVEMPKVAYYALGQIDPKEVRRYTPEEALMHGERTMHYGPWDENLAEALGFDPSEHPRGTHGHFAKRLEGLHVGETLNLPTAVTVRRRSDGFHVRVPGKKPVVHPTAARAARAALRENRLRKKREKFVPAGDARIRALASRLGYAVPLQAVYPPS